MSCVDQEITHEQAIVYGEDAIRRMQNQGMSLEHIQAQDYILVETDRTDADGVTILIMLCADAVRGICRKVELENRLIELERARNRLIARRRRA